MRWGLSMADAVVADCLAAAMTRLACLESAALESQLLLAHVTGRDRAWVMAHGRDVLDDSLAERFNAVVERRVNGEPLAYITGERGFWMRDFKVTPATLIPRPETECLVAHLLESFADTPMTVLDLGTGSGCIAVSLADERPSWRVIALDRSEAAVTVARENAAASPNVAVVVGSWLDAVAPGSIDIIACNPPYIRENDPHLPALGFEPASALIAGPDGLDDIRLIAREAITRLRPGGTLLLEHGYDQQPEVCDILDVLGYRTVGLRDLGGQPRVVVGTLDGGNT